MSNVHQLHDDFGHAVHSNSGSQVAISQSDSVFASEELPCFDQSEPEKILRATIGSQFGVTNLSFDSCQHPLTIENSP